MKWSRWVSIIGVTFFFAACDNRQPATHGIGRVHSSPPITLKAPDNIIVGDWGAIRLTNARSPIRIYLVRRAENKFEFSWAEFKPDNAGKIDTSIAVPLTGTYENADAAGLFWSRRAISASAIPSNIKDFLGQARADGFLIVATPLHSQPISTFVRRLSFKARGIKTEPFPHPNGTASTIYLPKTANTALPGVVMLGGSTGEAPTYLAARLAAEGRVVLSLNYQKAFAANECGSLVEVSKAADAIRAFANRSDIVGNRVTIIGVSLGSELALQLANKHPQWLNGVAVFSPSLWRGNMASGPFCARPEAAWTVSGKTEPYLKFYGDGIMGWLRYIGVRLGYLSQRDSLEEVLHQTPEERLRATEIDISGISVPLFAAAGEADEYISAARSTRTICKRLARSLPARELKCLVYERAHHAIMFSGGSSLYCTAGENGPPMECSATAAAQRDALHQLELFLGRFSVSKIQPRIP